ncbi:MAG TPA: hypothetical protein VK879_22335 [Candidatus Sulfomarinibacteraceae bacterium]|nr:hypothetical protein [Candidatus Sulfomarinibacteraceae bacterium]
MRRFMATFLCDVRLQWRNGFYAATVVLALFLILVLDNLPPSLAALLLPVVIVNNLIVNGFYFISGLVLLEKGEGTLRMQVVTPLRPAEYLAAKGASLVLLSLLENVALVLVVRGSGFQPFWLLAGVSLGALFYTLAGFTLVSRYHGVGEFLLPSFLYTALLAMPLLPYFGITDNVGIVRTATYAHPLQPVLTLLQGAMEASLSPAQGVVALAAGTLWTAVAFVLARRAFERFVRAEVGLQGGASGSS